ncbi:hypothetical protein RND71_025772 [Anisodus tanguticus]|uniref:Uncharacterized protein n=1 Tax=Anisodus tanguticus TaxID=243964 RepID=A0AAE1RKW7_9SOLA|nr:hypothetical protein RND71_025772 [Anisodus tanguticus]
MALITKPYAKKGVGLPKGNGGVQRFPRAGRRLALECKGRRKLDCKTHPSMQDFPFRRSFMGVAPFPNQIFGCELYSARSQTGMSGGIISNI